MAVGADVMSRCTACAACRTGCPTFDVTLEEGRSGRGRVQLALRLATGVLEPSDRSDELLGSCTNCGWCERICPVGLPVMAIIGEARAAIRSRIAGTLKMRILAGGLLRARRILNLVVLGAAVLQRILRKSRAGGLDSCAAFGTRKPIPRIPWRSALSRRSPRRDEEPTPNGTADVSLFLGCRVNYIYPEVAGDARFLLERAGARVSVPPRQVCSGAVLTGSGFVDEVAPLRSQNAASFPVAGGSVATLCGGCRTALRSTSPHGSAPDTLASAEDWTRVLEARGFHGPFAADRLASPVLVHEPCGLNGTGFAVRMLGWLRRAGLAAQAFRGPNCCGGTAAFSVSEASLSAEVGEAAWLAAVATGAGTIVTGDPGCLLQFSAREDAARRRGEPAPRVLHAATVLRLLVAP